MFQQRVTQQLPLCRLEAKSRKELGFVPSITMDG